MKPAPPVTRMFFGVYGPVSAVPVRSRLIAGGPGSISADEVEAESREGAFIHGLYVEGARWDTAAAILDDALPKQLYPPMPVVLVKAAAQDKAEARDVYACPVYKTQQRGPTYVFTANLKTKAPPAKWVLGGVALLMDVVE